jgi:hypothetical protein
MIIIECYSILCNNGVGGSKPFRSRTRAAFRPTLKIAFPREHTVFCLVPAVRGKRKGSMKQQQLTIRRKQFHGINVIIRYVQRVYAGTVKMKCD